MTDWDAWLAGRSAVRARRGLAREDVPVAETPPDSGPWLDLASNDMHGLSRRAEVIEAAQAALAEHGAGARASRLVVGTCAEHRALEEELAAFAGAEAALVFSSGYTANLGLLGSLSTPGSAVVLDEHAHASMRDGCRLGRGETVVVPHNDVAAVRRELEARPGTRCIVAVESVYSVLSDAAPLRELAEACRERGALLFADEAHGLGLRGEGRGLAAELGLWEMPGLRLAATATLSKALGSQGGAVLGSAALREHLVNEARPFIFDTALAPASAAAALASMRLLAGPEGLPGALRRNVERVAGILGTEAPAGAVVSVAVPSAEECLRAAGELRGRGILVGAFRPPSVPDGRSRLRFSVSSALGEEDLRRLEREARALGLGADDDGEALSAAARCPVGLTAVTDPAEAAEAMRRNDFAPDNALTAVTPIRGEALRILARGRFGLPPVLASHAGPQHAAVRTAVESFFSPRDVRALRGPIRAWTAERMGLLGHALRADLAAEVVRHVPPRAFTALTGVEVPPPEVLQPWSLRSLELFWGWPDADRQAELARTAVEFHAWLRGAVADAPDGTLFERVRRETALAGVPVTEQQLVSLGYFLVIAGQETTSLLVNTAVARAAESPSAWAAAARGDTARLARRVLAEESSVPAWRRVASRDTRLGGRTVRQGEELHVTLSGQGGASSLAFGGGAHRCLGALLAPLEAEEIVAGIASAWPDARLAAADRRLELSSFSAPTRVLLEREGAA